MRNIALWGLQIVLALLFVAAGSSKLGGSIDGRRLSSDGLVS